MATPKRKDLLSFAKEDSFFKTFLVVISLTAFFLATTLIVLTLYAFLDKNVHSLIYIWLVVGAILSFFVIKTSYIMVNGDKKKQEKHSLKEIAQQTSKVKLGAWNSTIFFLRMLFFNLANELFLVLFFWIIYMGIISLGYYIIYGVILFKNFETLATILGLIGIISGFSQYFINEYRGRVVEKTMKNMAEYLNVLLSEISFKEFINYLKNKNQVLHSKITSQFDLPATRPLLEALHSQRSGNSVFQYPLYNLGMNDEAYFSIIERSKEKQITDNLIEAYKGFFQEKQKELKNKIDLLPIDSLRKIFFEDYYFFNDMLPSLETYDMTDKAKKIEDPQSYSEFKQEIASYFMRYLVFDKIMGVKEHEESK